MSSGSLVQVGQFEFFALPFRYAKDAENLLRLSDAYLNMGLVLKTRARVEFRALWKKRSDCGVGLALAVRFLDSLQHIVKQVIHYGAIQTSDDFLATGLHGWIHVLRDGIPVFVCHSNELVMCKLDRLNSRLRRQVEAMTQFDGSTYYRGVDKLTAVFGCPLICAYHVIFPEINTGAKPVIVLSAGLKRRTAQELLGGFEVASVICKD